MTVTMSSEGDSSKSDLPENNEKNGSNPDTDSSQDALDISDAKTEKASAENSIEEKEEKDEKNKSEDKDDVKPLENNEKSPPEEKVETETKPDKDEVENDIASKSEKKTKKEKPHKEKKEVQKEKDEDKSEENSEKDEDSDKEGDKEVPLLDQPLEKSGKRERKNVQRFNEEFAVEPKEGPKPEFSQGAGTSLGDIPRVDASISRFKNEDLKTLHRILFKTVGKTTVIKKNIRKFNGFDFKKDSEEYTKKFASLQKLEIKHLKSMCEMLDLPKTGTKDDLVTHIMEFLIEPKDSGKPVDGGRPKRTAAVRANNRGYSSHDDYSSDEKEKTSRARRDKGKRTNLKDDTSSDEEFQPNSDGSEEKSKRTKRKRKSQKKPASDDDEESEVSVGTSDDSDQDEPKAKRKKSPAKTNSKSRTKATPGRRGRPSAPSKKTPSRGRKAKAPSSDEDESDKNKDEGSSSEDEPLAKKAKNSQPPTDDEIKTFIKSILEGANLEEITMKTVCQRVYDNYPDFDLTHKKYFIKSTVKSLIST